MPIKMIVTAESRKGPVAKVWTDTVEDSARQQLENLLTLPFIHKHIAVMPDVHMGYGSTVGSVIPTKKAIIPAAVGVDIGCGMMAVQTSLTAKDLPDSLAPMRAHIERVVPHGFETIQGCSIKGAWDNAPESVTGRWIDICHGFNNITHKYPQLIAHNPAKARDQLGTLGGGNHFVEVCLDESDTVWVMLHSGSRGIGNMIGTMFINMAKEDMRTHFINLVDWDLAYLPEGTKHFDDYWYAMQWAQKYAMLNREVMMQNVLGVLRELLPPFHMDKTAINCHHNYSELENHYGQNVYVTRKGAVRARKGDLGIIPGSMGARSYIVEGLGNPESFNSCSHGAGRTMSRTEAKKHFTVADLAKQTQGVECKKDESVLDEIPGCYKDIDVVMEHQNDLVRPLHMLRQVLCVKG